MSSSANASSHEEEETLIHALQASREEAEELRREKEYYKVKFERVEWEKMMLMKRQVLERRESGVDLESVVTRLDQVQARVFALERNLGLLKQLIFVQLQNQQQHPLVGAGVVANEEVLGQPPAQENSAQCIGLAQLPPPPASDTSDSDEGEELPSLRRVKRKVSDKSEV